MQLNHAGGKRSNKTMDSNIINIQDRLGQVEHPRKAHFAQTQNILPGQAGDAQHKSCRVHDPVPIIMKATAKCLHKNQPTGQGIFCPV